jgi:hypothetical protein
LEQVAFVNWCRAHKWKYPALSHLFAIPNGGQRHIAVARKLKAEGVEPGVPDLCLAWPTATYHSLYIEMKANDGRLSDSQKEWKERLISAGFKHVTAWTWIEAANCVIDYIGMPETCRP